jgi:predicted house-cleaning noncanonical NTP pyrophosphatase (MazG superfamily)
MDFTFTNQEFENEYPKLVRDNIPALYKARTGKDAKIGIIKNGDEFLKFLCRKMVEEAKELEYSIKEGNTQEELADVMEIIDAILKLREWALEDIRKLQNTKRSQNGGFEKRIILLEK